MARLWKSSVGGGRCVEFTCCPNLCCLFTGMTHYPQVTFTLPEELMGKPLLYSGLIKLLPTYPQGSSSVVPLTLPYQGYAGSLEALRLPARPISDLDETAAMALTTSGNALCYSPGAVPAFLNEVMDHLAKVPDVCSGGLAAEPDSMLRVSLKVLQQSPECSLRVTMAAEVPFRR